MARKVFVWSGKKVSRTTYFRNKRKGLSAQEDQGGPVGAVLPLEAPPKAKAPYVPKDDSVDELVRDFMVMVGRNRADGLDLNAPVMVPPRTFKAIIRVLETMGY